MSQKNFLVIYIVYIYECCVLMVCVLITERHQDENCGNSATDAKKHSGTDTVACL